MECGHDDCVKLLIDHNAHVDAVDKSGNSGLHLAVLYNHPKIVKLLTSKGANVNIKNKVTMKNNVYNLQRCFLPKMLASRIQSEM